MNERMTHIIYMAAGNSRRFGSNKLLFAWRGKPMFRHGLEQLAALAARRQDVTLTVVTQYEEITAYCTQNNIHFVYNPESREGLSYTIRAGIQSIPALQPQEHVMFVTADQPELTAQTVEALLAAAVPDTETAAVCWQGTPGSPTLFSAALVPELLQLTGDEGGKKVMRRHKRLLVPALDGEELRDLDTPEEIQKNG